LHEPETPFEHIESAHEYIGLLEETVTEAVTAVDAEIAAAAADPLAARRLKALQLAVYKLGRLEQHLVTSRRLLNDLRTLRRLLLEERSVAAPQLTTSDDLP
jgi:hypothetical protein